MSDTPDAPHRPLCLVVVDGALEPPSLEPSQAAGAKWVDVDVAKLEEACDIARANIDTLIVTAWGPTLPAEDRPRLAETRFVAVVERGDDLSAAEAHAAGALRVIERGTPAALLRIQLDELAVEALRADELERGRTQIEMLQARSAAGFWEILPGAGTVWCSPAAAELLTCGHGSAGEPLDAWLRRFPSESRERFEAWIGLLMAGGLAPSFEHTLIDERGAPRRVRHVGRTSMDGQGRCQKLTAMVEEVASRRIGGELASTSVRGAPDTRLFLHLVERAIRDAGRTGQQVAVLHIDVHRVRSMTANALSSDAAELLLASIAQRVREGVRATDVVGTRASERGDLVIARWAGEHLTVLLPGISCMESAAKVATRILELLARPFEVAGHELCVPASIGIAGFPGDHHSADELVRRAETASYCARQDGQGAFKFYSASLDSKAFERLTLETSLRRALERGEFSLHYQPRVSASDERIVGFEALLRWKHPELGSVSPADFIPLAEQTGLIVPIGEWVLGEACRQNREWQDAGLPPVRMAVNLSGVQFVQPALLATVQDALTHSGLDAQWLELELTESTAMRDASGAVEVLRNLKALGIHLSIDDFGTGYSSLAYLRRFPIDALKIDRSFIAESASNPEDAAIVTSIVRMARSLGLAVVAEGVEEDAQLLFLRALDCDEIQGYLYSPPVPAAQAAALLASGLRRDSEAA